MIKKQILIFLLRCVASSFGIWLCVAWFGNINSAVAGDTPNPLLSHGAWVYYFVAGLIFSLCNSIVKPLVRVMVLPLAIITMGFSTVFINIGMILLTLRFLPGVEMSFWDFAISSILMSLINGLVNLLMPSYNKD